MFHEDSSSSSSSADPQETFSLEDLGLMHLFTTSTYLTMADCNPNLARTWQVAVPSEAVLRPYLMHGLLSLAALHQITLDKDASSHKLGLAVRHHNLALAKSKPILENITEQTSSSLFALSATIAVFALALPISPASPPLSDPVDPIVQVAILMRGSKTIVQTGWDWIKNSPLAPLLRPGFLNDATSLPQDLEESLSSLEALIVSDEEHRPHQTPYCETLEGLRQSFRNAGFSSHADGKVPVVDRAVVLSWLAMMHSDFIPLLSQRLPITLVMLAHYAVALHTLESVWWCQGWGRILIAYVEDLLDESWQESIAWPKQQIDISDGMR